MLVGEREPTRARYPDEDGYVERAGARVFWERYGDGQPTLHMITTPWPIAHSRIWRAQIAYFARHFRVVVHDPLGNGRSDRPRDPDRYALDEVVEDLVAVLDASQTDRAVLVAGARGAQPALRLAADHPDRALGLVLLGPQPRNQRQMVEPMLKGRLDHYEGWDKFNPEYWREDFPGFLWWFARECFPEPHRTRDIEAMASYGFGTDPETLIAASRARGISRRELPGIAAAVRCPSLVICGGLDTITPPHLSREVADALGAPLRLFPRSGHSLASDVVELLVCMRAFVEELSA